MVPCVINYFNNSKLLLLQYHALPVINYVIDRIKLSHVAGNVTPTSITPSDHSLQVIRSCFKIFPLGCYLHFFCKCQLRKLWRNLALTVANALWQHMIEDTNNIWRRRSSVHALIQS